MRKILIIVVGVCFWGIKINAQSCCGNPSVAADNENILNLTTLSKKQFAVDVNADYIHFNSTKQDTSHLSHNHHNHNHGSTPTEQHTSLESILLSTVQIRYGLHDKLTLQTQFPIWIISSPEEYTTAFGDIPLLATYRLVQKENYGIGISGGVELPTGYDYQVFGDNYLITGSGSFDPIIGASSWFRHKKFLTRLQTQYRQGMKGYDDITFGSTLNSQWIIAYYLKNIDAHSTLNLVFNMGINQNWTDTHAQNGKLLDNTGSHILWYHAGTQILYKKLVIPVSFAVPMYMQLRGMQNEPQFRIKTGLTLLF